MKKGLLFVVCVLLMAGTAISQEKIEKKTDRKVELKKSDDGVSVKITEDGKVVFDKSYASMDELKQDPELESYNLMTGESDGKVLMFKDADGNITKMKGDSKMVWVSDDKDVEFTGDGDFIKVRKDGDGQVIIEKDGEMMKSFGAKTMKIQKQEDGTYLVEDENGSRVLTKEEMKKENVFVVDKADMEGDGNNVFYFKGDGEDGEVKIELKGDNTWVTDEVHDKEHNVMVFSDSDIDVQNDGERVVIRKEMREGNGDEVIEVIVERIHIEISDVDDMTVVEEIPGSKVEPSRLLQLDDVSYYPNPNNGSFTLRFAADDKPTQVRVIDMMGKEVYAEDLQNFSGIYDKQIDLSDSEKGVYILQIIQGKKTWNKKLAVE